VLFDPPESDERLGLAFGFEPPEPDERLGLAFGFEPPESDERLGLAFGFGPAGPDERFGMAFGFEPPEPDERLGVAFGFEPPDLRGGVRASPLSRELEPDRGWTLEGGLLFGFGLEADGAALSESRLSRVGAARSLVVRGLAALRYRSRTRSDVPPDSAWRGLTLGVWVVRSLVPCSLPTVRRESP
jgi:hypothetical protein